MVLTVLAKGTGELSYQWQIDHQTLVGATDRVLTLRNIAISQSGFYSVVVTDSGGSVTSSPAAIRVVLPAPQQLALQPALPEGQNRLGFRVAGDVPVSLYRYFDRTLVQSSADLSHWVWEAGLHRTNWHPSPTFFKPSTADGLAQRFYKAISNHFPTPLPPLSGAMAIGTRSELLVDGSRTNLARHTPHQFMISGWYPANPPIDSTPGPYVDKALSTQFTYATFPSVSQFTESAFPEAPFAVAQKPLPVILYSPSINSHRRENLYQMENLASHGFIVFALDHRDTFGSVQPKGYVSGQTVDANSLQAQKDLVPERVRDLQFVLDQLSEWNSSHPFWRGRMDLARIGAFGLSVGGASASEFCRIDPRCRSCVNLDGWLQLPELLSQGVPKPSLALTADLEKWKVPAESRSELKSIAAKSSADAYFCQIEGTVHWSFSDMPLIAPRPDFESLFGSPRNPLIEPSRVAEITSEIVRRFFSRYLQEDAGSSLDNLEHEFPEVLDFLAHIVPVESIPRRTN